MERHTDFDVVIVGGSYAGLSAAMALGRSLRRTLVIDSGKPCNQQTPHSHNFLTHDGNTPAAIAAAGRSQVLQYPTVSFMNDEVKAVEGEDYRFVVLTAAGERIPAKKIIFATGLKDHLPDIPGYAECWGISAIHCPYCHGYEYKGQTTGILVNGEQALDFGKLIRHWTDQLTIFTNGKSTIPDEHTQELTALQVHINEAPVQQLVHRNGYLSGLLLDTGELAPLSALYTRAPFTQHCPAPQALGCALTEAGYIQVDEFQHTTVKGVFAAGDNSSMFRAVSLAVAAGTKAGAMANHELIQGH